MPIKRVQVSVAMQPRAPGAARVRQLDFPLDKTEGETLSGIFDALVHGGEKFGLRQHDIEHPRDAIRWWLEQVQHGGRGKCAVNIPVQPRAPGAARSRWLDFPLDRCEGETLAGIFDEMERFGAKFDGGRRHVQRPRDAIRWMLEQVHCNGDKEK